MLIESVHLTLIIEVEFLWRIVVWRANVIEHNVIFVQALSLDLPDLVNEGHISLLVIRDPLGQADCHHDDSSLFLIGFVLRRLITIIVIKFRPPQIAYLI